MLVYILKFSACLAIFLAFYKLFLERENMHQFKRFYLIGIILTSIIIPFITFTKYIEAQPVLDNLITTPFLPNDTILVVVEKEANYLPIILWSIYGLGVLLFGLKFGFNLVQMILKIKKNPKLKSSNFINVLLQDLVTPHTFFSYIFLNKHKYETHQIPQEVILHEQTHAKQKHSIDVLFIEFLQVIFWFNPLIHFIKKSIKLNHEFLADKAVLKNGVQANNYQHILLSFSFYKNESQLANAINYSSIKKRITVMKTQTSKQKIWLRSFILLPLLALTLYSFSERIEIVKEKNELELLEKINNELPDEMITQTANENQDGASREQMKEYERLAKHYNSLTKDQLIIKKEDLDRMKYIYHLMSDKQKKDTEPFPVLAPPPPPPAPEANEPLQPNSPAEPQEPNWLLINSKGQMLYNDELATLKTLESDFESLSKNLDAVKVVSVKLDNGAPKEMAKKALELIKKYGIKVIVTGVEDKFIPPPPPLPENATEPQKKKHEKAVKNYKLRTEKNELARIAELKKEKLAYQEAREAKIKTEKGELTRVRVLSNEEVAKLKKEKEAYKDRQKLELPQVREVKSADVEKLKKEKLAYQEARVAKLKTEKRGLAQVKEQRKEEDVLKLKQEKIAYAEAQRAKLSTDERLARVKEIQTPEPPKSPLDHVIDMAKKDAIFYLEGKEISSDKAIEALKKNKSLNIETIGSDSNQPKVYITKKPIVIKD